MSLPSARDVYNKTQAYYPNGYIKHLEQQNEKMLDALINEYAVMCKVCKHDCSEREGGCYQQDLMRKAIESASGLYIDEAIRRWEDI